MARKLSKAQTKLLDRWMDENPNFNSAYDMTQEQENTLDKMNSFENLFTDVERYVSDRRVKERYGIGKKGFTGLF